MDRLRIEEFVSKENLQAENDEEHDRSSGRKLRITKAKTSTSDTISGTKASARLRSKN